MQKELERKLLTRQEAANELDISVWTLDRWVKLGKAPKPVIEGDRTDGVQRTTARWSLTQIRQFRRDNE